MLTLCGSKFSWSRRRGVGSTFISDLNLNRWPEMFYVKSKKTGDTRLFLYSEDVISGQGEDREVTGRQYISPGNNLTVTVWNT